MVTSKTTKQSSQQDILITPSQLEQQLPCKPEIRALVDGQRARINQILSRNDDRMLVILGPCSVHDSESALHYASKLRAVQHELNNELELVMRVYFEKPRSTIGWKGLINDPKLNQSNNINQGYEAAREILLQILEMGIACGTEYVTPYTANYIDDCIAWSAIGARTVSSQVHREFSSALPHAVGFKNDTHGNVNPAIDAMVSVAGQHDHLTLNSQNVLVKKQSMGNTNTHIILRGGTNSINYKKTDIEKTSQQLAANKLDPHRILVDCSHGNSQKDYRRQRHVAQSLCATIAAGCQTVRGIMLESHLVEGRQDITEPAKLRYGQSITDSCINWETTAAILTECQSAVIERRKQCE